MTAAGPTGKSLGLTAGQVARRLHLSVDTITRHLVPADEWKKGSPQIPYVELGGRRYIPRWWLTKLLAQLEAPPE